MKANLLTCIFLLYASSVMGNEVCLPEDICLSIDSHKEKYAITCDKVVDYSLITFITPNDEIEITLDPQVKLPEIDQNNVDNKQLLKPYIFGRKLNEVKLANARMNKLVISLYRNEQLLSVSDLTSCIDYLKSRY